MNNNLDLIRITGLKTRTILGIHPHERVKAQEIRVNFTLFVNTQAAAHSDCIDDAVDYNVFGRLAVQHIENSRSFLIERLGEDLAKLCFTYDQRIQAVKITTKKTEAVSYAKAVGVTIYRTRENYY